MSIQTRESESPVGNVLTGIVILASALLLCGALVIPQPTPAPAPATQTVQTAS